MDPVSAIAVAAASIDFLKFSLRIIGICYQIRTNPWSSTHHNRELEASVETIEGFRQDLKRSHPNEVPQDIVEIADKCLSTTDGLIEVLEYVRGKGRQIGTVRAAYRVIRKRYAIERLEDKLKAHQKALDSMLIQEAWSVWRDMILLDDISTHFASHNHQTGILTRRRKKIALEAQQSDEFSNVQPNVQSLVTLLIQQHAEDQVGITSITKEIASLNVDTRKQFDEAETAAQSRFDQTEASAQERFDLAQESSEANARRQQFLQSLFFHSINERQSNIKDATEDTLEWIFDKKKITQAQWSDFGTWLQGDKSTYWISGKAGSGKSTLMAHLVKHARTRELLEKWSSDRELRIFSFSFWRPGVELQNNVLGLLRSLLYQLCEAYPDAIDQVMTSLSLQANRIPAWTEGYLRSGILAALSKLTNKCFCLFLDGLDEFIGDYGELLSLIAKVTNLKNVKCCLSSRPEVELSRKLEGFETLRLQDLNREDITQFVLHQLGSELEAGNVKSAMVHEIITRAEGVFLWVSLVTRIVVRAILLGDDEKMLWERIRTTPSEINDLFKQMLDNVDPLHKENLRFYIQCVEATKRSTYPMLSIAVLVATKMAGEVISYEDFARICRQTEIQVIAQSAGLLELALWNSSPVKLEEWQKGQDKYVSMDKTIGVAPVSEPNPSQESLLRRSCDDSTPYPPFLHYETLVLIWVHRSAHDFIYDNSEIDILNVHSGVDEADKKVFQGFMSYLRSAPSCSYTHSASQPQLRTWTHNRMIGCLKAVCNFEVMCLHRAQALDALRSTCIGLDAKELIFPNCGRDTYDLEQGVDANAAVFWATLVYRDKWDYIVSHLDWLSNDCARSPLLLSMILRNHCCYGIANSHRADLESSLEFAKSLFVLVLGHKITNTKRFPASQCCVTVFQAVFWNRNLPFHSVSLELPLVNEAANSDYTDPRLIINMALALYGLIRLYASELEASEQQSVLRVLQDIMGSYARLTQFPDVYIELSPSVRNGDYDAKFGLQLSLNFLWSVILGYEREQWASEDVWQKASCGREGLRIAVPTQRQSKPTTTPTGAEYVEAQDVTVLTPSPGSHVKLLSSLFRYDSGGRFYFDVGRDHAGERAELVMNEIWAVEAGLSPTQQLFACEYIHKELQERTALSRMPWFHEGFVTSRMNNPSLEPLL